MSVRTSIRWRLRAAALLALSPLAPATHASLVAHWKLDEGTGSNIADSSTGNHPGTTSGAPVWLTSDPDLPTVASGTSAALTFDGTDDWIDFAGYKGVTGTTARTAAAWVRTADTTVAQDRAIVAWGNNTSTNKWVFRLQSQNGTQGTVRVEVSGGYVVGNTVITDGLWHHVAVVWEDDGTPDITDAKLYVDGILDADLGSGTNEPSATNANAVDTAAGIDVRIGYDHSDRYWKGDLDEIRIYDEALDANAIADLASGIPVVTAFAADAEAVAAGTPVDLSWEVGAFDTLILEDGSGPADVSGDTAGGTGGVTRNPTVTTTYTLTGTSGTVSTARALTVLVDAPPVIGTFTSNSGGGVPPGGVATLRWDTFGATALSISPEPGDVTGSTETTVTPAVDTTYTLTATNPFGMTTADLQLTVLPGIPATVGWTAEGLADGAITSWDPSINQTANTNFRFAGAGGTVASGASNFPGINSWIEMPRFNLSGNPGDSWQEGLGDAVTQQDVTWELVFRPGDFTGTHVLFNTGGNGDGTAIVLTGSTLDFRFQDADSAARRLILSTDLSALGTAADFFHVVCLADVESATTGTGALYVNGSVVAGPTTSTDTIDDWDGGDLAELGFGVNLPTSTGFEPDDFTGDIAVFNYYGDVLLTAPLIMNAYLEIAGPPAPLAITEVRREPDGSVFLRWNALSGRTYGLDLYDPVIGWFELLDSIPHVAGAYTDTSAIGVDDRVYRIRDETLQGPP